MNIMNDNARKGAPTRFLSLSESLLSFSFRL